VLKPARWTVKCLVHNHDGSLTSRQTTLYDYHIGLMFELEEKPVSLYFAKLPKNICGLFNFVANHFKQNL